MRDLTRHPRRGFTTIELLVVIGIILLLMGLLILGFRQWDKMASTKQTRAQLGLCKSMLTEYERTSGFKYIEGPPPSAGNTGPIYVDQATGPYVLAPNSDLSASGNGDLTSHSTSSARYFAPAVRRMWMDINSTPCIMKTLASVPSNRSLLSNVPANRLLEAAPGSVAPSFSGGGSQQPFVTVLDGWANPIIFVPRGGMIVNIKDPTNLNGQPIQFLVRTSGTQRYPGTPPALTAMDRPFFASAGQDGDFTTGEDNVYSFQQD